MKLLRQVLLILLFCVFGKAIQNFFAISIPGNVIGMLLLFAFLHLNLIKIETIEDVSDFLLSHMSFFFIPPCVGLISYFSVLKGNILSIVFITFISTVLVIATTGLTIQILQRRH